VTSEEIAAGLVAEQAWQVCEAVRALAKQARVSEGDPDALAAPLASLAGHASAEVRREVADAADLLAEDVFALVIGRLGADTSHYVAMAAARAAKRRAAQRKERARTDEDLEALAGMFREIEDAYDPKARLMAERLVRHGRDLFARRFHHEVTKAHSGLELALVQLSAGLEKPRLDRAALREHTGVALARKRHLVTIAARALASTATMTPAFRSESLGSIVEEAREQLVERLDDRAGKLSLRVRIEGDVTLDADRGALLQALANVLQNAVEAYGRDAREVAIEVRGRTLLAGSQVELAIEDRGAGMSEELMRELFVPFGSQKPGGTGVGMIVVRKMVEEVHGGVLRLESAPGEGTVVTIVLPREQR
jgi:signal transduction histidine kinase